MPSDVCQSLLHPPINGQLCSLAEHSTCFAGYYDCSAGSLLKAFRQQSQGRKQSPPIPTKRSEFVRKLPKLFTDAVKMPHYPIYARTGVIRHVSRDLGELQIDNSQHLRGFVMQPLGDTI